MANENTNLYYLKRIKVFRIPPPKRFVSSFVDRSSAFPARMQMGQAQGKLAASIHQVCLPLVFRMRTPNPIPLPLCFSLWPWRRSHIAAICGCDGGVYRGVRTRSCRPDLERSCHTSSSPKGHAVASVGFGSGLDDTASSLLDTDRAAPRRRGTVCGLGREDKASR
jgi:hypothetical protein